MNGDCLLDTNTVIALYDQVKEAVKRVREADELFLSSTVLGELYYGAEQSGRVQENTKRIDQFAEGVGVLGCDHETAREYGRVKNELRRKGRMIPENDLWIAAVAKQFDVALIARDRHFSNIEALHLIRW